MAVKKFKAESKRLLDLMINSIYTHKDIFLRELISNCSDAIDKRHFMSLTEGDVKNDYAILIEADEENKILSITDDGCGMTEEELESNLGTIAQSGTLAFKKEAKTEESLIGQFGVGFYSAFMVAKKVTVLTRAYKSDKAFLWESEGAEGYTVKEALRADVGTTITLYLKEDDEDCAYSDYLNSYTLKGLVKKYSDYIRYPIKMETKSSKLKEGSETEYETTSEVTTLNSMVPLWKKPKGQVSKEEYDEFYRSRFRDFHAPQKVLSFNIEGNVNYNSLIFLPEKPPMDYFSRDFEKGLMLYCGGVLIMEKCGDLLPDYLGFLRGIVDSPDLSLNISREMLQKDRQLRAIALSLEKKILSELEKMLKNERESYEKFFKEFGTPLKMGAYENFGAKKDNLKDLLLYVSSADKKYVTLAEYVGRLKEGQDKIYYAVGESVDKLAKLPQAEKIIEQGFEILYLTDKVDEFVIKMLETYEDKMFVSVADAPLTEQEKKEAEKLDEDNKELLEKIKRILDGKVDKACFTNRLKTHPVCISAEGEISLEMEKVLRAMPGNESVRASKVFQINAGHPLTQKIIALKANEKELERLVKTLYGVALLLADMPTENSAEFAENIVSFM